MKTSPPAVPTAAYLTGVGKRATTCAGEPGRHATIVFSQCAPV